MTEATPTYKKKDFVSNQEVRWCPGCGDYAILSSVQKVFAGLGVPKENFVIVSGIGCSSRFPYYMDTYGFHSLHGRAAAVASGIKLANPELDVWIATGDGDCLAIGGNHFIHTSRRNLNIKILMFNNRIYGLTKGQFSPTSEQGKVTTSSPVGAPDAPFNPISLALGSGASFVARTVDSHIKHMQGVLEAAHAHKGFAYVEILQNCVIFNDGAFDHVSEKSIRDDRLVDLQHDQPMVYGKEGEKGLLLTPTSVEMVPADQASSWDVAAPDGANAYRLSQVPEHTELPIPIGIFRSVAAPTFEESVYAQIEKARETKGAGNLEDLIWAGDRWEV